MRHKLDGRDCVLKLIWRCSLSHSAIFLHCADCRCGIHTGRIKWHSKGRATFICMLDF